MTRHVAAMLLTSSLLFMGGVSENQEPITATGVIEELGEAPKNN